MRNQSISRMWRTISGVPDDAFVSDGIVAAFLMVFVATGDTYDRMSYLLVESCYRTQCCQNLKDTILRVTSPYEFHEAVKCPSNLVILFPWMQHG